MMKRKGINSIDKYLDRIGHNQILKFTENQELNLIIVVPSCGESLEDLVRLRKSLENQTLKEDFDWIIVLNNDEKDKEYGLINSEVLDQSERLKSESFQTYIINKINLPTSKKNGVGLARKIGMDEACIRFQCLGKDGIIICLDADCTVEPNYLQTIKDHFKEWKNLNAFSLGFEHSLNSSNESNRLAISSYELHLRYFINAQKSIGLPYAVQTVGSSMAVRASAYAKEGGMPVLKAGEDFYFLHKFISNNSCGNISEVLVYPSGRTSERVPFGTGRAVNEILNNKNQSYTTYQWQSFLEIRNFLLEVNRAYLGNSAMNYTRVNSTIHKYLEENKFGLVLESCKSNSSSMESFYKRFFQWFNAFRLMKLLHYLRDKTLPNQELLTTINHYQTFHKLNTFRTINEALSSFRELDKNTNVRPALFQESL